MATETDVHHPATQPIACTLTPANQKTRLEEWRELRHDALLSESRDDLVWTTLWRGDADVRARLEALIEGERDCCSFLTFEVEDADDAIRLRTVFPPSAEGMLDAFIR